MSLQGRAQPMIQKLTLILVSSLVLLGTADRYAEAQQFRAEDFERGPRFKVTDGQQIEIWNPAKLKLLEGGPMIGGTVRATDARTYCAMASAGYDFVWVEMQHEAITWEQIARMWRTCPGPAAPGARVAYTNEREIQHATDMGALVVVVPTIDTVEEAQEAINWTYFPPIGRRSFGGGQGASELWSKVPGGYRETWNENVVLILMIETLEGVENAREIAKLPGATALFAASGDLGNFSGFAEGDAEYEALITEVETAAAEAGIHACAPLRWADRSAYTCFQASTEAANIRRGAQAEIRQTEELFKNTGAGVERKTQLGTTRLLADLAAQCDSITYEADCYTSVQRAATTAGTMSGSNRAQIGRKLLEIISENPNHSARIREIVSRTGLTLE